MKYHYAFEAVRLLQQCLEQLGEVIEYDEASTSSTSSLYDMKEALFLVESALFCFFSLLVQDELASSQADGSCIDLATAAATLQAVLNERQSTTAATQHSSEPHSYYTSRSVTDSLLFRLNVGLQLCLVRIQDARSILYGGVGSRAARGVPIVLNCLAGGFGVAATAILFGSRRPTLGDRMEQQLQSNRNWILPMAKITNGVVLVQWLHRKWGQLWMSTKLTRSTEALEAWCRQWQLFMDHKTRRRRRSRSTEIDDKGQERDVEEIAAVDSARNQRLIEYALNETPKVRPEVVRHIPVI